MTDDSSTSPTQLTAAEAAARLGIKRSTLYAYVSRGLLHRSLSLDGRTSLFDSAEIDRLRGSRRRSAAGEMSTVIASSITVLDESGHRYRGTPAVDHLDRSFEDVADLIWQTEGTWLLDGDIDSSTRQLLTTLSDGLPPDASPLDRIRVAVAAMSSLDPMRHRASAEAHCDAGRRMIGAIADILPRQQADPSDDIAGRLWARLTPTPGTTAQRRLLDASLTLLADHGLAASTFAARIAASVRADPYSIVTAGLGAVGGTLHGAASGAVWDLIDQAADEPQAAVGRLLAGGHRLPGVGHTVYRSVDPRHEALFARLVEAWAEDPRLPALQTLADDCRRADVGPLNVDFALGAWTWLAGMNREAGEVIFAAARIVGWIAHGIEEAREKPVRFRPVARSVPPRPSLPEDATG